MEEIEAEGPQPLESWEQELLQEYGVQGETPDDQFYAPEGGWMPEDFGQMTVAAIPYTSHPWVRPDPQFNIQADGWLYIEVGQVRIAIPDREEWDKIVTMVNRQWNSHERTMALRQIAEREEMVNDDGATEGEAPPEAGLPTD